MVIDDPSVMNVTQENVFEGGQWKRQMVVETTLNLDASDHRYDPVTVAALEEAIVDWMKAFPALIDSVLVRPYRENA